MNYEKSCGAIIIDDDKVLLIKQGNGDWGFPKGHMIDGESEFETAIREVKEETNIDILIDENHRYVISYMVNENTMKDVVFFIAKKLSNVLIPQESEIDKLEWLDMNDALNKISHEDVKGVLKKVMKDYVR